jgi:hypothetical protein
MLEKGCNQMRVFTTCNHLSAIAVLENDTCLISRRGCGRGRGMYIKRRPDPGHVLYSSVRPATEIMTL